ncbi:hypothetical protein [Actinoplanes aureus]|uniref:Secreted protein/lipoprotein n=1 Tax=Actinoplanes aureus TaxID=2792083 RepID=A0A931G397_9ACTN|nr:hypothetical protein [Actinoplanes aureus]MBG0569010.1 hypothetical protein [Actinoplanes aureus]
MASLGFLVGIAAVGCTSEASPDPTVPSASQSKPSAATIPDATTAGRDAIAAYRGMWQAYTAALAIPDPAYPDLARYADGEALDVLTEGVQETKDGGLKGTGGVVVSPEVTSAAPVDAPTEVQITDCLDSSGSQIVRASPGPPYSDSPGGKRRAEASVRWQPSGWKVSSFGVLEVGTC